MKTDAVLSDRKDVFTKAISVTTDVNEVLVS